MSIQSLTPWIADKKRKMLDDPLKDNTDGNAQEFKKTESLDAPAQINDSLEQISDEEEKNIKTRGNKITVICSDGVKILVDLDIFPSEVLRAIVKHNFKDSKITEILYDSKKC